MDPSSGAMEPAGAAGPARAWDRRALAVVALSLALLVAGAWRVGPTFDEHYYVASGYLYWRTGSFGVNLEHPPLVKLLAGLPLLLAPDVWWRPEARDLVAFPRTWFFQFNGEHVDRNLFLARLPACLLTALLAWAVYRAARRLFSPRAAFFATAAFALSPSVLAHGRLAALDGGLAAFLFLAVASFAELAQGFTWRRLLVAGATFGLANLAKFTALLLVPFTLAVSVALAVRRRSARPLLACLATWLVGLSVFAAGYGFEALSVVEAWNRGNYLERPEDLPPLPPTVDALVPALAQGGLAGEDLRRAAAAADVRGALSVVGEALAAGGDRGERALAALSGLAGGPGPLRRDAFAALLDAPLDEPAKRPALAALSGVELAGDDLWRAWFAASRDADWDGELFRVGWIEGLTRGALGDVRPIPLLTAFKGIDYQLDHAATGHQSYFRGRALLSRDDFADGNPFPWYYAVVLLVKSPVALVLASLAGLACALRPRGPWTGVHVAVLVGFPALLVLAFSRGNALLGVKYVLPALPFAALWCAALCSALPRLGAALCAAAVLEGQVMLPEAAPAFPNELMYYNALAGGPVGGPWTTVVGDDWGQDVRTVGRFHRRFERELRDAGGLWYAPYTRADPTVFGLADLRRPEPRVQGIVAVHAVDYYRGAAEHGWLADYRPFARLGWSVYLYDTRVPPPGGDPLDAWERGEEAR